MKKVFLCLMLIWMASPVCAADWYVSHSGGGAHDGTSCDNAWAEWIGIDWDKISDGDTLHICDTLSPVHDAGIQHSNITITGDGVGKIDFAGNHATLKTYAWYDNAGHHATNVTIRDLEVCNSDYRNIYLTAADENDVTNNKVINCKVHDVQTTDNTCMNIDIRGGGVVIKGCIIYNSPGDLVYQRGDDFTFTDNVLFGVTNEGSAGRGDGIQCSGGHSNITISRNYIDVSNFIEPKQCIIVDGNNVIVAFNYLHAKNYGSEAGNHSKATYFTGSNINIHHNEIIGGYHLIWLYSTSDVQVVYNVLHSLSRGGIDVAASGTNVLIANNTIFDFVGNELQESCYGMQITTNIDNVQIKNNIVVGSLNYGLWINGPADNDYNCLYNNSQALYNKSPGPHSIFDDPQLSGYHISQNSPARNMGVVIDTIHGQYPNWARDIDDDPVVDTPDIGADEYRVHPHIGGSLVKIKRRRGL